VSAEERSPRTPDWRELPVLVTGGAGFIGSHLVDALVERGARVRVLDDLSTGRRENLAHLGRTDRARRGGHPGPRDLPRAAEGVRFVFHQAALGSVPRSMADPATTIAVNVAGTANVFAAARDAGVARVVYASSSSVYGDSDRLPKREGEEGRPLSPYALSKAMDEELAGSSPAASAMELVGLALLQRLRPPAGPGRALRRGRPALLRRLPRRGAAGASTATASRAATSPTSRTPCGRTSWRRRRPAACGRAYNVAGGRRTKINELAREIRSLVGAGPVPVHAEPRPGDVRHSAAEPSCGPPRGSGPPGISRRARSATSS
jgi:nucleoside-diphosphate-sugar epimerase